MKVIVVPDSGDGHKVSIHTSQAPSILANCKLNKIDSSDEQLYWSCAMTEIKMGQQHRSEEGYFMLVRGC